MSPKQNYYIKKNDDLLFDYLNCLGMYLVQPKKKSVAKKCKKYYNEKH